MKGTGIRKPPWKARYAAMGLGAALFLSPFALIPQAVGEVNLCGVSCPRMFFQLSPAGLLQGWRLGVASAWFGASLVAAILLTTFCFGRLWCSHLCPIGGTTELASRLLPRRLKLDFSFVHAPAFRYAYFLVYAAGAWLGLGAIACKFCNFRIIPFLAGAPFVPGYRLYLLSSAGLAGLLTVALTGLLAQGGRAYCNVLCPIGALDGLVNFLSEKLDFTRKVRTEPALCDGCGACAGSCMVWALKLGPDGKMRRDQTSCMSCRDCVRVCPSQAIRYGKARA